MVSSNCRESRGVRTHRLIETEPTGSVPGCPVVAYHRFIVRPTIWLVENRAYPVTVSYSTERAMRTPVTAMGGLHPEQPSKPQSE